MKKGRNCDGTGDELYLAGVEFNICPIKALNEYPDLYEVFQLYVDCCGYQVFNLIGMNIGINSVRHLPFPGGLQDQPAVINEAFRIIASAIQRVAPKLISDK